MTINIPDNLTPQAQELVRRLLDTRRQEVEVLSGLSDEGYPLKAGQNLRDHKLYYG